jgi:hypothetical protein
MIGYLHYSSSLPMHVDMIYFRLKSILRQYWMKHMVQDLRYHLLNALICQARNCKAVQIAKLR